MNKVFIALTSLFLLTACNDEAKPSVGEEVEFIELEFDDLTVEAIIDSVYMRSGSGLIDKSNIYFDFRDFEYAHVIGDYGIERSRKFTNEKGEAIEDLWVGDSLKRTINGKMVKLSAKEERAYKNSINSVFYFGFLPKALKDPAVNTELIDEVEVNGKMYYKIKVTFDEEGGGEDFQDIFLYWIGIEDFGMDYMAYQYFTEGGGIRFRATDKVQEVNGILFRDYLNYGPKEDMMDDYINVDKAYVSGELKLVSEIRLENIEVN